MLYASFLIGKQKRNLFWLGASGHTAATAWQSYQVSYLLYAVKCIVFLMRVEPVTNERTVNKMISSSHHPPEVPTAFCQWQIHPKVPLISTLHALDGSILPPHQWFHRPPLCWASFNALCSQRWKYLMGNRVGVSEMIRILLKSVVICGNYCQ